MQLFGLVNEMLKGGDQLDIETRRLDLSIRRYSVVPLSHDAGLVGVRCFLLIFSPSQFHRLCVKLTVEFFCLVLFALHFSWPRNNQRNDTYDIEPTVGAELRHASISYRDVQKRPRHSRNN